MDRRVVVKRAFAEINSYAERRMEASGPGL